MRDYGTAQWVGGDAECEHKAPAKGGRGPASAVQLQVKRKDFDSGGQYPNTCKKCGAVRIDQQIGLEQTPAEYVAKLVAVFAECWRVLRDDGTLWLVIGDSYNGSDKARGGGGDGPSSSKQKSNRGAYFENDSQRCVDGLRSKNLLGIPWRVAFALQDDGWYLRQDIIWAKAVSGSVRMGTAMPESVQDRCCKSHEYLFLLTKSPRYYFDAMAIADEKQPLTATRRSVWLVNPQPFLGAHFATFPPALIEPMILAGTSPQACEHCGAPWKRMVEKTDVPDESAKGSRFDQGKTGVNGNGRTQPGERFKSVVVGWSPTCACADNTGSGKCIVLDPFAGSGTTLAVAAKHHRRAVGLELNAKYIDLAHKRLSEVQPVLVF